MKALQIKNCWLLLFLLASCSKKQQYNATPNLATLSQYIQGTDDLTLFRQALQQSGLDSVLASGGPYTIFAPVDSAFTAAGLTSTVIANYSAAQLRNILSFHILPGRIGAGTLTGFLSDTLESLNSQHRPIVTQNNFGMFLNGVKVTEGNIDLADGVIQKLSAVSFPPTGDLLATLDSLPNTKMAAYIFHKSPGMSILATNIASIFGQVPPQGAYHLDYFFGGQGYSSATMLIPSDDAFKGYGYNTTSDLDAIDSVDRTNMLTSCILFGTYFTCDFDGGRWVGNIGSGGNDQLAQPPIGDLGDNGNLDYYTSPNNTIYQNYYNHNGNYEFANDGVTINGSGIIVSPHIIQPNILATNGVIHIIDQVFAPNGSYSPKGPQ